MDRSSAQVVGTVQTQSRSSSRSALVSSEVVDAVPTAVVTTACPESGRC